MTCFTKIHYYKMENNYVILITKIFFAFFACYCKEFEIFFAKNEKCKEIPTIVQGRRASWRVENTPSFTHTMALDIHIDIDFFVGL